MKYNEKAALEPTNMQNKTCGTKPGKTV